MKSIGERHKLTIQIYNQLGKKYIRETKKVIPADRAKFIKQIPQKGRVLDAGCAGGRDTKFFVKAGLKVVGIDVATVFLKEAKKYVPQARFIKMDVKKLQFPKDYFDAIWAHAVLLHVTKNDLPRVLKSFLNILKTGGLLHIHVKRDKGEVVVREKLSQNKSRLFTFFFKKELEQFVRNAGFKILISKFVPDKLKRENVEWITVWAEKLAH